MPTYSYRCGSCGHEFDVFHGMNEGSERVCVSCGAMSRRLIGRGAGLIFKGSGFYETDYKRSSASSSGSTESHAHPKEKPAEKPDSSAGESKKSENSASPAPKSEQAA